MVEGNCLGFRYLPSCLKGSYLDCNLVFILKNTLAIFVVVVCLLAFYHSGDLGVFNFPPRLLGHWNKKLRIGKEAIQQENWSQILVPLTALCHQTIFLTSLNLSFFIHKRRKNDSHHSHIYMVISTVKRGKEYKVHSRYSTTESRPFFLLIVCKSIYFFLSSCSLPQFMALPP